MRETDGVTVIAEMGSCHDRDFKKALRLVDAAKLAGADYVKAQYWSSSKRLADRRHASDLKDTYEKHRISHRWLPDLSAYCKSMDIGFACTSYLPEDVSVVATHADLLKIASFEASDPELLRAHVFAMRRGKTVVVSLGLGATGAAVDKHLRPQAATLDTPAPIVLMHCVSCYPTPSPQLHLARLWRPDVDFRGFSDHSAPDQVMTGALAVAAGAIVVERHLRLEDTDSLNPDYPHSMDPHLFSLYVTAVRFATSAVGRLLSDGPMPCEAGMLKYAVEPPR